LVGYSVKAKTASNYESTYRGHDKKVTHLTTNTPSQLSNAAPIWSRDGKWIVFTQSNAAGKDANIFIVSAGGGKATNLTPHEGEHNYFASDISPDGKTVLITPMPGNGYANAGLLISPARRSHGLPRTNGRSMQESFLLTANA